MKKIEQDKKLINALHSRRRYLTERAEIVHKNLADAIKYGKFVDKSTDFLNSMREHKLNFAILAVDIMGSTALANKLEPKEYERITSAFLYEVSQIMPSFHGHVLKYLGDGLIAYFYHPENKVQTAMVVLCAETILDITNEVLNPAFVKLGLPEINVRIGIDAGMVYVATVGSPNTKRHSDLVGNAVNMTMKIQGLAKKNEVCIGESFHNDFIRFHKADAKMAKLPVKWKYENGQGKPYKVFYFDGWERGA